MTFDLYDVAGYRRPLRLSADHAALIGATPHGQDTPAVPARPGTKAFLIAEAIRLGLPTDGTRADIEARIAGAS
jgi:hypothetical protein